VSVRLTAVERRELISALWHGAFLARLSVWRRC
jgi:hypothetical protein